MTPLLIAAAVLAVAQPGHGFAPSNNLRRGGSNSNNHFSVTSSPSARQMFTGIVEEMGEVISLETKDDMTLWDGTKGSGTEMSIKGEVVMDGAYLGCSIAVNGVCLTATELDFDNNIFRVGLAPETLRKTNLGSYTPQSSKRVNLERASEIGGRNSGHFVQGHVDEVGTIIDRWVDENSLFFKIAFPYEFMRYVVPKGFVAIDGTSLTVCDVKSDGPDGENWFTFMLVEYTQKKIIIPSKQVGDTVNIEVDVLGKYSERAWEAFVPKMEALESKVRELEAKVAVLEGKEGGASSKTVSVQQGEVLPKKFQSRAEDTGVKPEKWVRTDQEFYQKTHNLNTRDNRDSKGTDWVRTKQTFYDTNY
mmetsp:Transcript_6564/g.11646  ORF Transcript_6564/g.11646 Transcript_6564/m.11646 type:complete len:362 (+) Transcript_6564:29-1114(+)